MLEFKNITIDDYKILKKYLCNEKELSCENSFANLFLWHGNMPNQYDLVGETLIIKTQDNDKILFRVPLGGDLQKAMDAIYSYYNNSFPDFYGYEGETFDKFRADFGDKFDIVECPNDFEYLYLSENLIELSGKKYHSKRNHISSFTKNFDWHYETIGNDNIKKIRYCAEEWYQKNSDKMNGTLSVDKNESMLLLSKMNDLELKGGAIFVDGKAVAYTIGTEINESAFDIMIEKALPEYATAYAVINREFAKNELSGYKYINREDDMGIEGLRKAKLSYKPEKILKKYMCFYRKGK